MTTTSWKKVEYSKNQIVHAGKIIRNGTATSDEIRVARKIIDNWRASHAFPLQVFYVHLKRLTYSISPDIVVAQRLKRLDSIISKLQREPTMSLWTMQDIGGCRVIVPSVDSVYEVAKRYKRSRVRHQIKNEYDYITNPKCSGYRSLHLVYQYQSDKKNEYNRNMLIEIQVRTKLEHLWATAVETWDSSRSSL
jgi:(p)ppGpp synthase/HD superfamily hydrolase